MFLMSHGKNFNYLAFCNFIVIQVIIGTLPKFYVVIHNVDIITSIVLKQYLSLFYRLTTMFSGAASGASDGVLWSAKSPYVEYLEIYFRYKEFRFTHEGRENSEMPFVSFCVFFWFNN